MDRRSFLLLLGAAPVLAAAGGAAAIPVELRGNRFFAVPQALDGSVFACWLDTNGSGFIFDSAVAAFGLPFVRRDGGRRAVLPPFRSGHDIPPVLAPNGELPVFERSEEDKRDPILRGFQAQLGATWFAGRIWRLDYPGRAMHLLASALEPNDATAEMLVEDGYPRVIASAGDEPLTMSVDTGASIAYAPAWRGSGPEVQATSFVPKATLEKWHAAHPAWRVDRDVSLTPGCDRIVVPLVRIGGFSSGPVAFTTRPGDDVFAGDPVAAKLGANAYADCAVTLDYPNRRLRLDRESK